MSEHHRPSSPWQPSRRDVLLVGIGGLMAAVPFARRRPLTLVRRHVLVMGTIAEFAVAHAHAAAADAAIDDAIEALRAVDRSMSRFAPTSDVGRANRLAAAEPVPVSAGTMAVLDAGMRWAADSGGAFDPCLGRATDLWDVTHRHEPPPARDTARFARRQLFRAVELGTAGGRATVRFHDEDVALDLGGIAKGYGVDRAVAALRNRGVEHALVGAGGDLYALGRSPAGEPWTVGIQSPDGPDALAGTLQLEDAAVATSGDYRQYFEHHAVRYHHLLDPHTGRPRRTAQRSVTVIAGSCMAADAAATLAFGGSTTEVAPILARHGARVAHRV